MNNVLTLAETTDPIVLFSILWPHWSIYDKQIETVRSVDENAETVVVAGNMLGKDFISAFIALRFFMRHRVCRVVTTSVKDDHLRVLWGEINKFIYASVIPLTADRGGPLIVNHRDVRKIPPGSSERCPISYLWGAVSAKGEGMAGHHAPATLGIIDEASGVDDIVYTQMTTWAGGGPNKRLLIFGNPNPCTNFFFQMVEDGDILTHQLVGQ